MSDETVAEHLIERVADVLEKHLGYTNGWAIPADDYRTHAREAATEILALESSTEREMARVLRRLVREGWRGVAADESSVCWYCWAADRDRRTVHGPKCLYVEAKRILAERRRTHV